MLKRRSVSIVAKISSLWGDMSGDVNTALVTHPRLKMKGKEMKSVHQTLRLVKLMSTLKLGWLVSV